ncbi:hypothetical protein BC834DRAFT_479244 [Gloeopeniophorella convolvens]|nr:hypothetical protein BC834DRAFT_479244 [Gloeopeniophorella convolvens]
MSGARGCFNCGGCAWCFRVVVVAVAPSSRALCADACTYSFPPLSPSRFRLPCRAWCGADGDRVFFISHLHRSDAIENVVYTTRTVPARVRHAMLLNSRTPGCKLPQGGHAYLVNASRFDQIADRVKTDAYLDAYSLIAITVSFTLPSLMAIFFFCLWCGVVDGRMCDDVGGMEGHVSRDCTMEQKAKSCYRCGQEGHIVRRPIACYD